MKKINISIGGRIFFEFLKVSSCCRVKSCRKMRGFDLETAKLARPEPKKKISHQEYYSAKWLCHEA